MGDVGCESAIWLGSDWGSGVTPRVAIQRLEAVKALVSICFPYASVKVRWSGWLVLVNWETYPADDMSRILITLSHHSIVSWSEFANSPKIGGSFRGRQNPAMYGQSRIDVETLLTSSFLVQMS